MSSVWVPYTSNIQNFREPSCEKAQRNKSFFYFFSVTTEHNILVSRSYVNAFFQKPPLVSISSVFKAGILQTPGKINHGIVKIKV